MSIKDYALELGVSSDIILKKLKELGHNYNNENDYLDDEDPKESKGNSSKGDTGYEEEKVRKMPARVAPIRQQPRKLNGAGMEVCVIKPTSVEDAREITETLTERWF